MNSRNSEKESKPRISGKQAAYVAQEALKRRPIQLQAPDGAQEPAVALVPSGELDQKRKAPPRVRKPSPLNDQCLAPSPDLESHRERLMVGIVNPPRDELEPVVRIEPGADEAGGNDPEEGAR